MGWQGVPLHAWKAQCIANRVNALLGCFISVSVSHDRMWALVAIANQQKKHIWMLGTAHRTRCFSFPASTLSLRVPSKRSLSASRPRIAGPAQSCSMKWAPGQTRRGQKRTLEEKSLPFPLRMISILSTAGYEETKTMVNHKPRLSTTVDERNPAPPKKPNGMMGFPCKMPA